MMFLAPTPFMVVLRKSDDEASHSAEAIGRSVHHPDSSVLQIKTESDISDPGALVPSGEELVGPKDGVEMTSATKDTDSAVGGGGGWRKTVKLPGASLLRARTLTKENVETRMASRKLAMELAASQAGGNSMGVLDFENSNVLHVAEDPFMDTRLVLLKKYGGGHVPTSVKIGYRLDALKKSLATLLGESSRAGTSRDIAVVWFVWFLILCVEKYTPRDSLHSNIFNCIFEICSAFGSVGLSIGSEKVKNASFSADLHIFSQFLLLCVMILGRTREFPSEIDGSLQLVSGDIITAAFLKPGAVVRRKDAAASSNTIRDSSPDQEHHQGHNGAIHEPPGGHELVVENTDV
jgi:hypothetical protein